jgi:hypothetical protein
VKNITLDRTTVLRLDADGVDRALDAAADRSRSVMTLPSTCAPSLIWRSDARNSPSIRPTTYAGPLHSILPMIDMSEPMQEAPFVVGPGLTQAWSCDCIVLPMTSVALAAAFLSFSGALLFMLFNMSFPFIFAGMMMRCATDSCLLTGTVFRRSTYAAISAGRPIDRRPRAPQHSRKCQQRRSNARPWACKIQPKHRIFAAMRRLGGRVQRQVFLLGTARSV